MTTTADDIDLASLNGGVAALTAAADPIKCTRNAWCIKEAGHRGYCKKYATKAQARKAESARRPSRAKAAGGGGAAKRTPSKMNPMPGLLAGAWATAGQALEAKGPEPAGPPAGRVMQFQAPLAGQQLDLMLSRLPVYKRVTATAQSALGEQLAGLVAAPVLASVIAYAHDAGNEKVRDAMMPLFSGLLYASAVEVVKVQRQQIDAMDATDEYRDEAGEIMRQFFDVLFPPKPAAAEEQPPNA